MAKKAQVFKVDTMIQKVTTQYNNIPNVEYISL